MKLVLLGANPVSSESEAVVFGYAKSPGTPWIWGDQALKRRGDTTGEWEIRHMSPSKDIPPLSAAVNHNPGATWRIKGTWPVLLMLSHPFSGRVRFLSATRYVDLDLYRPQTTILYVDPLAGVTIDLAPAYDPQTERLLVKTWLLPTMVADALKNGREVRYMPRISRLAAWLSKLGVLPHNFASSSPLQRRQWASRLPFGVGWLLSGGFGRGNRRMIEMSLLPVYLEHGAATRTETDLSQQNSQDSGPAQAVDNGVLRLLIAAVEGLADRPL